MFPFPFPTDYFFWATNARKGVEAHSFSPSRIFFASSPHDRRAQMTNDLLSGEGDPAKKEASLIKLSG